MAVAVPINAIRARVGESAAWHAAEARLYTVDVWRNTLWRHDPATGHGDACGFGEMAAAVVTARGGIVVALETCLVAGIFGGPWASIAEPVEHPATHRFNDATADPVGRLIVGTMQLSALGAAPTGVLHAFDGATWRTLATGFWTLNGLAFSVDGRTLYVSDSHPDVRTVWAYPYDAATATVGARRMFADMAELAGRPDGAAVDAEDHYWVAGVGGGVVYRFDPAGRLVGEIALPVENPTRVAFGGPGLDRLYVTSMAERLTQPDPHGLAGATLELGPGVIGAAVPPLAWS